MGRGTSSQWDFGELFPPEPARRVYSVTELTGMVKALLERELKSVWVAGEVSNFRVQSSGHIYFTLKDAGSQLSCVLFRGTPTAYRELVEDGQKLFVQGELTVYEPRGQYQLVVRALEVQGLGALQLAFEKLKQRLQAEGLFAPERKRPLPRIIHRLGVVSSPTGAALRDVLHVVQRRQPALEIVLAPCRVQGEGSAAEIARAIGLLNSWAASEGSEPQLDAILVTRGGGSMEDLWSFNEEVVARAIAASALPVISAVGHEIDFTISDFVADLRAATPSAAAELLTEGVYYSRAFVAGLPRALAGLVQDRVERERETLNGIAHRVQRVHPRRRLEECSQRMDDLHVALVRAMRGAWRERAAAWNAFRQRWHAVRPTSVVSRCRAILDSLQRRLQLAEQGALSRIRDRLSRNEAKLQLLSPQKVLERGYSITQEMETGKIVRDATEIPVGVKLSTRLAKGTLTSRVEPAE
jgi:exodeoxyribonuclease VII large subunit